jgi:hypothetical protein
MDPAPSFCDIRLYSSRLQLGLSRGGAAEAKVRFSEVVWTVESGEDVMVTRGGRDSHSAVSRGIGAFWDWTVLGVPSRLALAGP